MNRIAELRGSDWREDDEVVADGKHVVIHMPTDAVPISGDKERLNLDKGLQRLTQLSERFSVVLEMDRSAVSEEKRKDATNAADTVMRDATKQAKDIKQMLDCMQTSNDKDLAVVRKKGTVDAVSGAPASLQIRINLHSLYVRKFHKAMEKYHAEAARFKVQLRSRSKRQLKMVAPHLPDDQAERILDQNKVQDFVRAALVSENLRDVVHQIEQRHLDIVQLERQVLEIFELFRDLATLVDLQSESMDVIDKRIQNAKHHVEIGEVDLEQAAKYQKKSRKLQCCCMCILLVVLIAILTPTLLIARGSL